MWMLFNNNMWVALVFGVVIYKLVRGFINWDLQSPQEWKQTLADRLERVYGGTVFQALRIPDVGSGSRQNIDMVLLRDRELSIIVARNFSGVLDAASDGNWILRNSKGQAQKIPNLVEEARSQAAILESYLETRGVVLPPGYLSCKVILANHDCRPLLSVALQPEVISYDKWMQLGEESNGGFLAWLKTTTFGIEHHASKKIDKNLRYILSTSPTWDRLELKCNHPVLGEYLGFKGKKEDMDVLKLVKRSKVAKIVSYKSTMFNLSIVGSNVHLLCVPRDYRHEGNSEPDRIELSVRRGTEVVFQPMDAKKPQMFNVKKIVCLSLSP